MQYFVCFVRYWAKACAVLTCLLGTTWLLGLFFVGRATVVMAYLFNIFNVLQVIKGNYIVLVVLLAIKSFEVSEKILCSCRFSESGWWSTQSGFLVRLSSRAIFIHILLLIGARISPLVTVLIMLFFCCCFKGLFIFIFHCLADERVSHIRWYNVIYTDMIWYKVSRKRFGKHLECPCFKRID